MPCTDGVYDRSCGKLHVSDLTIEELKQIVSKREKEAKARKERADKEVKEKENRAVQTERFVADIVYAVMDFNEKDSVVVVFAEEGKSESHTWIAADIPDKFRKWLSECKQFPRKMTFEPKNEGRFKMLWSWHIH